MTVLSSPLFEEITIAWLLLVLISNKTFNKAHMTGSLIIMRYFVYVILVSTWARKFDTALQDKNRYM